MMDTLKSWLKAFLKNEDAPTFLEYALLIVLIAFVVIGGVTVFGTAVNELFIVGPEAF